MIVISFYKLLEFLFDKIGSDKLFLSVWYHNRMGYWMDFRHPKSFNEKLQWLKLYNRKPEYTTMVDKYAVKKYVAEKIGGQYLIPTLGVWNHFDEIDFERLPNQFVLKCTHDSGSIVICKDKNLLDKDVAKEIIENGLKVNYYKLGREWPYKNVPHRIIAEQYMEDAETKDICDYKFFCFNGKVHYFKIDFDRYVNHRANYYDSSGEQVKFGEVVYPPDYNRKLTMPKNLFKMISLAEKLADVSPFLRVDFYEINGKVFFGELTFFPTSGQGKFAPEEWDLKLGELIKI